MSEVISFNGGEELRQRAHNHFNDSKQNDRLCGCWFSDSLGVLCFFYGFEIQDFLKVKQEEVSSNFTLILTVNYHDDGLFLITLL
jgi:hypothetical protein